MNWRQRIPAVVWLGVGISIASGAYLLGLGALNSPGPGLFPFVIGIGMAALSLSIVAVPQSAELATTALPKHPFNAIAVITALIFYALALERIGFILCTLLFLVGLLGILGRRSWLVAAAASSGITLGAYLVFTKALKINLPVGPFGF